MTTVMAGDVQPGMLIAESEHDPNGRLVLGVRPAEIVDLVAGTVLRRRGLDELPIVVAPAVLPGRGRRQRRRAVRVVAHEIDLLDRGDPAGYVVLQLADGAELVVERTYPLACR